MLKRLSFTLPLLLAACALGDVANPTPIPPITLAPPPTITFQGSCDATPELDRWLQTTFFLAGDFLTEMNNVAALERAQIFDGVLRLAAIRNQVSLTPTPDCAQAVQELLSAAMNTAVDTLQGYVNGDIQELGSTIADVSNQIEVVQAMQQELMARLEAQYQEESQP